MAILINGIKFACEPCVRGHRSTKCEHKDRNLIEVRKPGRPLSSCPHPNSKCDCPVGIRVAVRKDNSCVCSGDGPPGGVQRAHSKRNSVTKRSSYTPSRTGLTPEELEVRLLQIQLGTDPENLPEEKKQQQSSQPIFAPPLPKDQESNHFTSPTTIPEEPATLGVLGIHADGLALGNNAAPRSALPADTFQSTQDGTIINGPHPFNPDVISPQTLPQQIASSCCKGLPARGPQAFYASPLDSPTLPPFPAPALSHKTSGSSSFDSLHMTTPGSTASIRSFNPEWPPFSPRQNSTLENPVVIANRNGILPPQEDSAQAPDHLSAQHPRHFQDRRQRMAEQARMMADHNCTCGDGCECVFCPTHPYTQSSHDAMRQMHSAMSNSAPATPTADRPSSTFFNMTGIQDQLGITEEDLVPGTIALAPFQAETFQIDMSLGQEGHDLSPSIFSGPPQLPLQQAEATISPQLLTQDNFYFLSYPNEWIENDNHTGNNMQDGQ
ncbi:MAG: hypothetical protein M1814_002684 [Vezdaea aestivalis]|nr:MAG: hypothetical protein M1814_002684 [Vezdaea aestivalis]